MDTLNIINELYNHKGGDSELKTSMKSKYITNLVSECIKTINPRDEIDMTDTFDKLYRMLESTKGYICDEDVNTLFLEVIEKIEDIQVKICPVLIDSQGVFKTEIYLENGDLLKSAKAYIAHIEDSFMSVDDTVKGMALEFYKHKTEIVRKSLNTLEMLCPIY